MADDQEPKRGPDTPGDGVADEDAESNVDSSADWSAWGNLWQVPAIVLSGALIFLGVAIATQSEPKNDFVGAFDQVEELIRKASEEKCSYLAGIFLESKGFCFHRLNSLMVHNLLCYFYLV